MDTMQIQSYLVTQPKKTKISGVAKLQHDIIPIFANPLCQCIRAFNESILWLFGLWFLNYKFANKQAAKRRTKPRRRTKIISPLLKVNKTADYETNYINSLIIVPETCDSFIGYLNQYKAFEMRNICFS
jgi:hypothetical protein